MFKFSRSSANTIGFRSLMAERVSRLFDAAKTGTAKLEVSRKRLSGELRSELRPQLSVSCVGSVSVETSGQPHVRTSHVVGPRATLVGVTAKSRRAAAAKVFLRMSERFDSFRPQQVAVLRSSLSPCVALRPAASPRGLRRH